MDALEKKKKKVNPIAKANVLTCLTFIYMFPIFKRSFYNDLQEEDLFEPLNTHKSGMLGEKLEKIWKAEQIKHKKFALHIALFKLFGLQFMCLGFLRLFDEIMIAIVPPLCISRIISYYEDPNSNVSEVEAYLQALAITLCLVLNALLTHPPYMGLMHLTMKMRIACSSLIYRKILKISRTSVESTTIGQIINLLSNDVGKFDQGFILVHYIWIAPIHCAIATYFLYQQIGVAAFFGVGVLLSYIPIQILLSRRTSILRLRTALRTDERVRLINEIVSGIQVIKMYCWEKPFAKLVAIARKKEMRAIRARAFIQGIFYSFDIFLGRAAVFVSILGYVLLGSNVTAEKVFTIKAVYDVLRSVLILHFWLSASSLAETNVSVGRIQKFLSIPEHEGTIPTPFTKVAILLENVSANTKSCLKNINLNITGNQIVAVIGPVGSGKSSLLNLLLKELPLESGNVEINGTISYSSQEPWLFAASVRQNILFNNDYDIERYQQVIEVCALSSDLKLLPHGDKTLVGEKGKVLSGGQKARINLARCIYNKADIYLLDDPLSAVDANVGKHLYENCVKGFLKDKMCILVTHQLQNLSNVDKIVVMKEGRIEADGTYEELQTKGVDVIKLIEEFQNEQKEEIETTNTESDSEDSKEPVIENEEVKKGNINFGLYFTYFKAGGGTFKAIILIGIFLSAQAVASSADYYISYWVRLEQDFSKKTFENLSVINETLNRSPMIYTYSGLTSGTIVFATILSLYFMFHFTVASVNLHGLSFLNLINATMRFFNTNPSGRILNRFSKDLGCIDEYIPSILFDVIQVSLTLLGSLLISFIVYYWLVVPAILLFIVFYFLRIIYLRTSRNVKRIEGITRSPIFGHATASIHGLPTIRTFSAQKTLTQEFDNLQDNHSSAWFLFIAANRSFGFWVDIICIIFFAVAIFIFMYFNNSSYGGDIGLLITQYTTFITSLQWDLRQLSELENNMVSVERLLEYKNLEVEPVRKKLSLEMWPKQGKIEFQNVSLKYNPKDAPVLKNLNLTIQPKEKIGIVGRTGAGKSSTISALFQLYPIEGDIVIDGVNITQVPLEDVRSKISIIPQEPVLFSGTLRKNLDPLEEYSDEVLWNALEQVQLKSVVSEMFNGLQSNVSEGGTNYSVGQRQLICLARAVIRNNKILVMDEATANVDSQTDSIIQNIIRNKFSDCTVLTVAHRLYTVMDSDKILVVNFGSVEEFDHPYVLLKNKNGILYQLVQNTGKTTALNLENIAKESYEKMTKIND